MKCLSVLFSHFRGGVVGMSFCDVPRGFFVKVFGLRLRYRLGLLQVYIAAAAEHIRIAGEAQTGVCACLVHGAPGHLADRDGGHCPQAQCTGHFDGQGAVDSQPGELRQDAGL